MTKTGWFVVVVLIVVVAGGLLWWNSASQSVVSMTPTPDTQTVVTPSAVDTSNTTGTTTVGDSSPSSSSMNVTVSYDGSSFSPSEVTVQKGGTVTFTDSSGQMWLASNPHPAHSGYDGTSRSQHCAASYTGPKPFDECSVGTSFTFTFNKVGTWGYHDHLNSSAQGTVTVVAGS